MEVMALGTLAVAVLVASVYCVYCKKAFFAIVGSIVAILLTSQTAYNWRLMLINSGKDIELLGFNRYPGVVLILCILFISAVVCASIGIINIARKQKITKRTDLQK